uniref:Cytochrome P450 n=1 Tax=Araucaria cunninghamii TaxID=56994 RepID=A0A0D6QZV0_ARACU
MSMESLGTLGIGVFFVVIWILCYFRRNSSKSKLPPGPRPWPIVGNLHQLGILPHRCLADLAKKYGPIMFLRLGSVPTVVVSSPAMAKEFLKTHDLIFSNRPKCATGKYVCYDYQDISFSHYGKYWRDLRKLCTLELLTAKRIDSFKFVREEEVSAMVRSVWEESGRGARFVDVRKMVDTFTRNIICRMFASKTYSDHDLSGGKGFKEMLDEMFATAGAFCVGDFIPSLAWMDLQGVHRRMKKVSKIFDDFAEKIIDEHINSRRTKKQGRVKDMVDVLLDLAEDENEMIETKITRIQIKAIILDLLNAGTETSSTTVTWAMSELMRKPLSLARAQAELETVVGRHRSVKESDVASCEYLRCVVKETFRLHPPFPLLFYHESTEGCSVSGYYFPPKTRLIVNLWAIGRHESVWEDAEEFKPERFIGKDIDVRGMDFELLPFGAGRRGCPGILAGLTNVELGLAQLLHCFDWTVEGEVNMEEVSGLTVPRKFPLLVRPGWRLTSTGENALSKVQ